MIDTLQRLREALVKGGGDTKWEENLAQVSDKPPQGDQTFAVFIQKLKRMFNGH